MDPNGRECIINLAQAVNANIDLHEFTGADGENPLPREVSVSQARKTGAWHMSDVDNLFMVENTQNREDTCEYGIAEAIIVLEQEQEAEQWASAPRPGTGYERDNYELSD